MLLGGCTPTPTDTKNEEVTNEIVEPLPPLNPVEYTNEPITIDDLLENEVFVAKSSVKKIQNFLSTQPGILKDYKNAAEIIHMTTSQWERPDINTFLLLIIIELKTGVISNPNLDIQKLYDNWTFRCGAATDTTLFAIMDQLACSLQFYREGQIPINPKNKEEYQKYDIHAITFPDGSQTRIPKDIDQHAFAVRKVLAENAPSKKVYEHWLSFKEGSLYDLYEKWFGWPNEFFEPNGSKELDERQLVKYKPKPFETQITIDDLLENEVFVAKSSVKNIQEFLNTQPGILKNYKEGDRTAAEIIHNQSKDFERQEANTLMLVVLFELFDNIITNPHGKIEDLDGDWNKPCKQSEECSNIDILHRKIAYMAWALDFFEYRFYRKYQGEFKEKYKNEDPEITTTFIFTDNSKVEISPNTDKRIYAVKRLLADFAPSKKVYEHWLSFEEGSLYDLYEKWFGWPNEFFDPNGPQELGKRKLALYKQKPFIAQADIQISKEQIVKEAVIMFPDLPKKVIQFISFEISKLRSPRLYDAARYTGFFESYIQNDMRTNFLARVGLLEKNKKELFKEKKGLTYEEWHEVYKEFLIDDWKSYWENNYSLSLEDEIYITKRADVFLKYIEKK